MWIEHIDNSFFIFLNDIADSDDATDLRCNKTLAQLRNMDNQVANFMQHQRYSATYSLPSPTNPMHHSNAILQPPSSHQHQHDSHSQSSYHNSLMNFQQQHNFQHSSNQQVSYNSMQDTTDTNASRISPSMNSSDYLNSMHQMVEANNLTQLHHNDDLNSHALLTTQSEFQPPASTAAMHSGVYHSHQQHLAALAAHAQAQVHHDQKLVKSSLSTASSSSLSATTAITTTAVAAASFVVSTMANQMTAASTYFSNNGASNLVHNLNDYDERSLSSLSNGGDIDAVTEDEDEPKDNSDGPNIDVTSSPQSPQYANFGNVTARKRKSISNASPYYDGLSAISNNTNDTERNSDCLGKNLLNGNSGGSGGIATNENFMLKAQFEGAVRPRSLEDMQKQTFMPLNGASVVEHQLSGQSQQQHQQKLVDDYNRTHHMGSGGSVAALGDQQDRLNDSDSVMNGSCASSEDLNQTNSSEQGEKITSGSDDEGINSISISIVHILPSYLSHSDSSYAFQFCNLPFQARMITVQKRNTDATVQHSQHINCMNWKEPLKSHTIPMYIHVKNWP